MLSTAQPCSLREVVQSRQSTIYFSYQSSYTEHLSLTASKARKKTMSLAPPFTAETANDKVKKAQDLWNTQYVNQHTPVNCTPTDQALSETQKTLPKSILRIQHGAIVTSSFKELIK